MQGAAPATPAGDEPLPAVERWITACKGGEPGRARFEVQAAATEAFLLGCLAQRYPGEKMKWDAASKRLEGPAGARALIDPPWRGQWSL